jgi:hypothetical protein
MRDAYEQLIAPWIRFAGFVLVIAVPMIAFRDAKTANIRLRRRTCRL